MEVANTDVSIYESAWRHIPDNFNLYKATLYCTYNVTMRRVRLTVVTVEKK